MQDIKLDDLEQVTGGAGVLDNMGTGAQNRSNRWAQNTNTALGGGIVGGFGAATAGLFGGILGGLQGLGHSLTNSIPLPRK